MINRTKKKKKNGFAFYGNFKKDDSALYFEGGQDVNSNQALSGLYIFESIFLDGEIEVEITFLDDISYSICDIVFNFEPLNYTLYNVGIGNTIQLCCIKHYDGFSKQWNMLSCQGSLNQVEINKKYLLKMTKQASYIKVYIDGVNVLSYSLPYNLYPKQIGVWCSSKGTIKIENFKAKTSISKAFVIMPFNSPYNEFYEKIIKKVCQELDVEVIRGDEIISTSIVMQDIIFQINTSNFIIAEVTEANPNVYYELGYAHAMQKQIILLAKKDTQIPFDISHYRVIYYDDSIIFKDEIEEQLKTYLKSMIGFQ